MLVCDRPTLAEALSLAASITKAGGTSAVYSNASLSWGAGGAIVDVSDGSICLRVEVAEVHAQSPGRVLLPAATLSSAVGASSGQSVRIHVDGETARIDCGDAQYELPTVVGVAPPPQVGDVDWSDAVTVSQACLARGLDLCGACSDRARSSAVLAGVSIVAPRDDTITLCGTDGKCLAEYRAPVTGGGLSAIASRAACGAIGRLCGDEAGEVSLCQVGQNLVVTAASGALHCTIQTRLIDGVYPAYQKAIVESGQVVAIKTADLAAALKRVSVMAGIAKGVILDIGQESAIIRTMGGVHRAETSIPCVNEGSPAVYGLNAGYLGQLLKHYHGDTLRMVLNGPGKGIVWRDEAALYLVMPLALPG